MTPSTFNDRHGRWGQSQCLGQPRITRARASGRLSTRPRATQDSCWGASARMPRGGKIARLGSADELH